MFCFVRTLPGVIVFDEECVHYSVFESRLLLTGEGHQTAHNYYSQVEQSPTWSHTFKGALLNNTSYLLVHHTMIKG